jgi:N-acetylneuraminate lyase
MSKHLTGLIAATFTPMQEGGGLKLDVIEKYAEHLVADGVGGVFVNGTSGESLSLTMSERLEVARRWVEVAGKDFPVIVHVGGTALSECKEMAAGAQQLRARAIACMAPCFFRPAGIEGLVAFCREVAAAAPKLDFYYYHIPSMTGVNFPMVDFLPAAADRIPTLRGAKFTYEDLADYARCVALMDGRFDMLFGRDQMLLGALALGAKGAVGTTYNFLAPTFRRLMAAFDKGDLVTARLEQVRATETIACLHRSGGLETFKVVMKMLDLDCGPVRPPLRNLTDQEYHALREELRALGFFDWRRTGGNE